LAIARRALIDKRASFARYSSPPRRTPFAGSPSAVSKKDEVTQRLLYRITPIEAEKPDRKSEVNFIVD
jgi:hypothetical protein